jgi:methionyl-tRNA formyltransferase
MMSFHPYSHQNRTYPIPASFPSEYIHNFGDGRVGGIHLTFGFQGAVVRAEADIINGPYKRMIIDDPKILRIFGARGDVINVTALHPVPKFFLDPHVIHLNENGELDMDSFDVGRLKDARDDRFDAGLLEVIADGKTALMYFASKNYIDQERITAQEQLQVQGQETVGALVEDSGELTGELESNALDGTEQQSAQPMEAAPNSSLPTAPSTPSPEEPTDPEPEWLKPSGLPPGMKPCHKKLPSSFMPHGTIGVMMVIVYQQIVQRLPDEAAHAAYAHYIDYARKEAVQSPEMRRQLKISIRAFATKHNIRELHNAYAALLQSPRVVEQLQLPRCKINRSFPMENIGDYMDVEAKEQLRVLAKSKGKMFMDTLKSQKACNVM